MPPASPYPPGTYDPMRQMAQEAGARTRGASNLLAAGAVLHALAIPIGLALFKVLVERVAGRSVSWGEIFSALEQTGFLALIIAGIVVQAAFAGIAVVGAFLMRTGRTQVAIPMLVVGIIGVIFSFAVFGGIVGAIGGGLVAAGGAKGRPRPPVPYMYPPTYGPPPFRPGP